MTNLHTNLGTIVSEIKGVVSGVDAAAAERLLNEIAAAKRIFLAGCGRSGLMAKAFAMRLMHLGRTAFVVGETTTPAIGAGDLLIVCSGKGAKETLASFMREAAKAGARCAAVTARPESPVARLAVVVVVVLPLKQTAQFGGSLFEQCLLVFFDGLVMQMIESGSAAHSQMAARHANLE
ncbi:MAG TPA: 6-phospho-3-hexuloisomerase [Planctomycetota bacterium]|nr:6-phospho-3-hexuloisomerase [Planctomycetota bacterium]